MTASSRRLRRLAPLAILALQVTSCAQAPQAERGGGRSVVPLPYVVWVNPPFGASAAPGTEAAESASVSDDSRDAASPRDSASLPLPVNYARLSRLLEEASSKGSLTTELDVLQAPGLPVATALRRAREGNADLLVHLENVTPPTYRYLRRNGWFVPNTIMWFFLGFPSFWVSDRVYELSWSLRMSVYSVADGRRLTEEAALVWREERPSSLVERGWTSKALYTPPGMYEGPNSAQALAPEGETWLAAELLGWLEAGSLASLRALRPQISIQAPKNLASVSGTVNLRATILSREALSDFEVFLNDEIIYSRDAPRMLAPRISRRGRLYTLPEIELDVGPGRHQIRIIARAAGAQSSQTLEFVSRNDSHPVMND